MIEIGVGLIATSKGNKIAEKEPMTTNIEQSIEKYFNMEDNKVLLQQKIIISTNNNNIKKASEKLEIKVPNIQDKKPSKVNILANGKLVEEQYISYDMRKRTIKCRNKSEISVFIK